MVVGNERGWKIVKQWDVLTVGETMVVFIPEQKQLLRYVDRFKKGIAGAESNVAIGVSKLGHTSCWISKLGCDELGEYVLREIRGEGVYVSEVIRDENASTGLMIKQFSEANETSVFYYRRNSAASTLNKDNISEEMIQNSKIIHITGVTSALSGSCAEMNLTLAKKAKKNGVLVSFDPNIRLRLWSKNEAAETLRPLLDMCDIVEIGLDEAKVLLDTDNINEVVRILREKKIHKIAVKLGSKGAIVADESSMYEIPPYSVKVIDNIGAGDAFAAGFLCGILEERDLFTCGKMGAMMGAQAVGPLGDIEGLPDRKRLELLLNGNKENYR